MSGISSLGVAASGMSAAQAGLYVLGHNLGNSETPGYVRQQVLQKDFHSLTIGRNGSGLMQVGLGTDIASIRQIRDKFLDVSYRTEVSKTSFYDVKYSTGLEIDTIIGELESQYKFSSILDDMWNALNELTINPSGLDARGNFISTAVSFVGKANNVYDRLLEYQQNLNDQVKKSVQNINTLVTQVNKLNKLISEAESSGDNANDYRDSRNLALDELNSIIRITYKEQPNGTVNILTEDGDELLVNGLQNQLGLRYCASKSNFVEPVFTTSSKILNYDPTNANARPLFKFSTNVGSLQDNDCGSLKGLMISRGFSPANYTMSPDKIDTTTPDGQKMYFSVTNCQIPKVMIEFDTLVHSIVTMINNALSPYDPTTLEKDPANAPFGLDGSQFTEIFVRKNMPRFNGDDYNAEDPTNPYSLYSIGNIMVNPDILNARDYDKIPLSFSGDIGDQNSLMDLLSKWKKGWVDAEGNKFTAIGTDEPINVYDFYRQFITNTAIDTNEAKGFLDEQMKLLTQIDNKRKQISGVSLDEEMKNILIYQHAYNASAKMLNVIDSMIDKIVNGTGRVGL